MIEISKGIKAYRSESVLTHALHEVDIKIDEGEFVAIIGHSGSGKTTLLNVIGLLEDLDSGAYKFKGSPVGQLSNKEKLFLRRENISFVFQAFNLIAQFSVLQNVELPLKYLGVGREERLSRSTKILEELNIAHRANHFPSQLSGGEQQRVAIARAAVTSPAVILADEPTGNLDSDTGRLVLDQLLALNKAGTTVVMVTHSEEASKISDRRIQMKDGEIF